MQAHAPLVIVHASYPTSDRIHRQRSGAVRWRTSVPYWARPLLAVVVVLSLAGCSERTPDPADAPIKLPDLVPASAAEVLAAVREPGASAVIVNVWATWCLPCREEFPDLLRVHRELASEGVRLVLVSADFPRNADDARCFLAEQGVDFPTFQMTGKDAEFIDGLDPRWSGALPATWIYDGAGHIRHFWEDKAPYATIRSLTLDATRDGES